jgi:amino acid transporter
MGEREAAAQGLHRQLDWKGAFWASSGVPAGVLLTMGGVATVIGNASWLVFIASIFMGFTQSFVYAEIAGLYPHKSGGASVYGAAAWLPYSKFVAPISVWCNWLAWSPVLVLGASLAAGYVVTSLLPASLHMAEWQVHLVNLGFIREGLEMRVNAVSLIGALFLLLTFALQHHGAAKAANTQKILGIICLSPLLLVGLIPLVTGNLPFTHLFPLQPLVQGWGADGLLHPLRDAAGHVVQGSWNAAGITLLLGAMFGAGWATYGFETAVCYTREFKNPKRDTALAILSAGGLCIAVFTLVPLAFQAHFGAEGMLSPGIYDGSGVAAALAQIVGGNAVVEYIFIILLILSLLLIVMTSMMGSSRTLYQASLDGWLPRYLSRVNAHGAPTAAMWTDLCFNLVLLTASDYFAVLMISNVCYLVFNFLNLQAGWIHRLDRPNWERPFKCPAWLLGLAALFGFLNMVFMGAGADVFGKGTLRNGLIAVALIIPVFIYRHYVQDKGVFPQEAQEQLAGEFAPQGMEQKRAGWLPWLALVACVLVVAAAHYGAALPVS